MGKRQQVAEAATNIMSSKAVLWNAQTQTLTLCGVVDIFEASALREGAQQALETPTACIDLTAVERLDLSALQVLCLLKQERQTAGFSWNVSLPAEAVVHACADAGLPLI